MIDSLNRTIDYLRISVTDKCNLRCRYCMPEEGVDAKKHEDLLRYEEIETIVRGMVPLGIRKIKLTGGEPLIRRQLAELVQRLKAVEGIEEITLTTNGTLLQEQIEEFVSAGISGINISLDTLDPEEYFNITRRNELEKAVQGLQEALKYPQIRLKINCVPLAKREKTFLEIAELARANPLSVRFIEMMPIGLGKEFFCITEDRIKEELSREFGMLYPYPEKIGNGPAHYYSLEGFQGKIGFISALSHKFCAECNRIRLTCDGKLKTCLQYQSGVDLREQIRSGASSAELTEVIRDEIMKKPAGHHFQREMTWKDEKDLMSQIGG